MNIHEIMIRMILDCYKRTRPNEETKNIKDLKGGKKQGKGGCCNKKKKRNRNKRIY